MSRGYAASSSSGAFVVGHGAMSRVGSPPIQIEFPNDPAIDRVLEGLNPSQAEAITRDTGPILRDTVET